MTVNMKVKKKSNVCILGFKEQTSGEFDLSDPQYQHVPKYKHS